MQKHNWKINIVNEWTGEKRSLKYNGTVDETKDFLLKLAYEDGEGTEQMALGFFHITGLTFAKKKIVTVIYMVCIHTMDC